MSAKTYKITGNTYSVREILKDLGCKWDAGCKAWITTDANILDQVNPTRHGRGVARAISALAVEEIAVG